MTGQKPLPPETELGGWESNSKGRDLCPLVHQLHLQEAWRFTLPGVRWANLTPLPTPGQEHTNLKNQIF